MLTKRPLERRVAERAAVVCPITLVCGGQVHYAHTVSLSQHGLLISDCPEVARHKLVSLVLTLPDCQTVSSTGEVCFAQPGIGIGIRFLNLKPGDRQEIRQLVRNQIETAHPAQSRRKCRTRRREPRHQLSLKFHLQAPSVDSPWLVSTENISRHGARLLTPGPLEVGQRLILSCAQAKCEIQAVIKYSQARPRAWRTGLHFLSFPRKWLIMELAVSALLDGFQSELWPLTPPERIALASSLENPKDFLSGMSG